MKETQEGCLSRTITPPRGRVCEANSHQRKTPIRSDGCFSLVRERRLELPRRLTHAPQTCLSTCSSTLACSRCSGSIESRLHPFGLATFKAKAIIAEKKRLSRIIFCSCAKKNGEPHFTVPRPLKTEYCFTPAGCRWPRPRTGGCRAGSTRRAAPSAPGDGPAPRSCRPSPPGSRRRCARWRAGGR